MQSARVFHRNPRQIAEELSKRIDGAWLDHTQVAGPGFLNFYLKGDVLYDSFRRILLPAIRSDSCRRRTRRRFRSSMSVRIRRGRFMSDMDAVPLQALRW